jgi:hypothetical protein
LFDGCASREFPNGAWKSALNVKYRGTQIYQIDVRAFLKKRASLYGNWRALEQTAMRSARLRCQITQQ